MAESGSPRRLCVVLFEGFELLDVFGPLEIFGVLPDKFQITILGPSSDPVASAQGPAVASDGAYSDAPAPDVVLVPGGMGNRALVADRDFLGWLARWAPQAEYVTSVCTGSAVLAAAGLLDGYRATSNKLVFDWAVTQGPKVEWVREARWVEDRDRWTSSGVAAGMDMTLAFLAHLHGEDLATGVANAIELEWHRDASWDPFARPSAS
jgi:transcriptional regulator GlxA family with amidase domain